MKKLILVFVITLLYINPVKAEDSTTYFGIKAGKMDPDLSLPFVKLSSVTNIGFIIGRNFNNFAFEGEITNTVSDNDNKYSFQPEWDIRTVAAYGAYRTQGSPFLKGKVGLLYEDISISNTWTTAGGSDSGLSAGIGVGFKIGEKTRVELEYTIIEADVNFVSLGVLF